MCHAVDDWVFPMQRFPDRVEVVFVTGAGLEPVLRWNPGWNALQTWPRASNATRNSRRIDVTARR